MLTIIINSSGSLIASSLNEENVLKILKLVKKQSNAVLAVKQSQIASNYSYEGTGYFPDPKVKLKFFGSPIETRNGPQRSNVMVSQVIPWPSVLRADEELASNKAKIKAEQVEILLLDLSFEVKSIIYKYVEISKKIVNKRKMIINFNNLNQVVLGRLKLGAAHQAEVSRINIEIAKLTQSVRTLEAKKIAIQEKLRSMTGGEGVGDLLPISLHPKWTQIGSFDPSKIEIEGHPYIRLAKAKLGAAQASIEKQNSKRLPKLGASVSWFQIDRRNSAMSGSEAGKDAWAIGASISIPVWGSKYDSLEKSSVSKQKSAQMGLNQMNLDLRTKIKSVYEEFRSTSEVSLIFANDIIPQAEQALKSDRESYAQGSVPFERIITDYIRVISFEDQLVENQAKQAALKASLERFIGKSL